MTQDIQDKLDAIKAPFQVVMEAADALPALIEADKTAFGEAEYLRGQASIVLPAPGTGELIYSQDDADRLAVQVRAENDEEVAKLVADADVKDAKIAELEALLAGKDEEASKALVAERIKIAGMIEAVEIDNLQLAADLKSADFK